MLRNTGMISVEGGRASTSPKFYGGGGAFIIDNGTLVNRGTIVLHAGQASSESVYQSGQGGTLEEQGAADEIPA